MPPCSYASRLLYGGGMRKSINEALALNYLTTVAAGKATSHEKVLFQTS